MFARLVVTSFLLTRAMSSAAASSVRYLNAEEAANVDVMLMDGTAEQAGYHFTLEQLMELAGLSVAEAIHESGVVAANGNGVRRILIVCGPGNNGGDGLVAARHAKLFGYSVDVHCARAHSRAFLRRLVDQLNAFDVPLLTSLPAPGEIDAQYGAVVDAVFGFSFDGANGIREPYKSVLETLAKCRTPIVSVDVPSGWHVENGNVNGDALEPAVLVSLTAPKLCARHHRGLHYVGGRFVPPKMNQDMQLNLPAFEGCSQIVRIDSYQGQRVDEQQQDIVS
jgi:NAD(P)H-hydrate epimerase